MRNYIAREMVTKALNQVPNIRIVVRIVYVSSDAIRYKLDYVLSVTAD